MLFSAPADRRMRENDAQSSRFLMKRNVWFAGERPPGALTIGDLSALGRSAISEDNPTDGHHVEAQERDPIQCRTSIIIEGTFR
jgi:hypothetical protein